MVYNDPERPDIARERQDVETPPLRVEEAPHHTGRGKDGPGRGDKLVGDSKRLLMV